LAVGRIGDPTGTFRPIANPSYKVLTNLFLRDRSGIQKRRRLRFWMPASPEPDYVWL